MSDDLKIIPIGQIIHDYLVENLQTGKIGTLTKSRITAKGRLGDNLSLSDYLMAKKPTWLQKWHWT